MLFIFSRNVSIGTISTVDVDIKIMSTLYLTCQKINIKAYKFIVITSSFLEVKGTAGSLKKGSLGQSATNIILILS